MCIFDSSIKWRMLKHLAETAVPQNVSEIAKNIKAAKGQVSLICKQLKGENILESKEMGRAIYYSISHSPLALRLKTDIFLEELLAFKKEWEIPEFNSVALYGSYASGTYGVKSDIDLLVITNMDDKKYTHS